MMSQKFTITKTVNPKVKPDTEGLKFGTVFSDHMFMMDYNIIKGWHNGRILPYGPIMLEPAAVVLHYAQEMFEGLKAYKTKDGRILLFRPEMNEKRTERTLERLCIPPLPEGLMVEAIKALVGLDREWVPDKPGTSLYIRPFVFANEGFLGVRPANNYLFMIILSPVGLYYAKGLTPTKIYVEDKYVRAALGGTGDAKIGANYAISLKAQVEAQEKGFEQVLWLDGMERKYVEEIGTSNAFFLIGDEVVTPPLLGTILPGITRNSVLTLLKDWGYKVSERRITIDEVFDGEKKGTLKEMWATGTAAVISPVGELMWKDKRIIINNGEIGELSQKLYDYIYGVQTGALEDRYSWTTEVL